MAAQALGALNAELIVAGRSEHAGHELVGRLRGRSPRRRVEFIRTDLSRQSDVRMLAARITQSYDRIDVLMNNAGAAANLNIHLHSLVMV